MSHPIPSDEDREELLLSCRYDDLEDIQQFVEKFGSESLNEARDESNNTARHMVSANGRIGMFENIKVSSPTS